MKRFNILIVCIAAVAILYILRQEPIKVDVSKYEEQINALEQKVDSLHSENSVLNIKADSLKSKVAEYNARILTLNNKVNVIQQETQARLDSVDKFGDDELERFFADRYRQHQDTIN